MALSVRCSHNSRLLSPSESLLLALLPSRHATPHPRTSPRHQHQQRYNSGGPTNRMKAQALPDNFDIRRLLELQKQPIWVREATKLRSHTIDEAIPSRWVQVKDVANNKMAAPTMLESLLARIDREKDSVVLLSMNGPTRDTALVAVQPRSELMAMDAEKGARREKMKREGGAKKTKQIELNWAIGENDLELKMKKMEQLLGKGMRVEMLFANKKRQRRAEEAEAGATLARVRERIREIGATEKSLSGKVAQQATLMVELNEKIETKEAKTSETQAAEA